MSSYSAFSSGHSIEVFENRLILAALKGDADLLRLSVGQHVPGSKLDAALCWAAFAGELTAVTLLVHQGASVNASDGRGRSPAGWAAYNGHLHVLQFLLSQGADLLAPEGAASADPPRSPAPCAALSLTRRNPHGAIRGAREGRRRRHGRRVGVAWASRGRRVGVTWASRGRRVGVAWALTWMRAIASASQM